MPHISGPVGSTIKNVRIEDKSNSGICTYASTLVSTLNKLSS